MRRDVEALRASAAQIGIDILVGYPKAAFREFWRVHDRRKVLGDEGKRRKGPYTGTSNRNLDRRVQHLHAVHTKDRKWFYFETPIPADIEGKISRTRVGGRPTRDACLVVFRNGSGQSSPHLFYPRGEPLVRSDDLELARFRQSLSKLL